MARTYRSVPGIRPSRYGQRIYEQGRELAARGLDLSHVIWDADHVLWDWSLSGPHLLGQFPLAVVGRLQHREYIAIRSGMLDLLWGLRHGALERDGDPHVRIWTSGYAWRLWKILREIIGFDELLGPPQGLRGHDSGDLAAHPRIIARLDYVNIVKRLLDPAERESRLAEISEPARTVIERRFDAGPDDPGFKVPELAVLMGKRDFAEARVLVDDTRRNLEWFTATGRSGVHVTCADAAANSPGARHLRWDPREILERSGRGAARAIAEALEHLADHATTPTIARAAADAECTSPPNVILRIDVPNLILWREWIQPTRSLKESIRFRLG